MAIGNRAQGWVLLSKGPTSKKREKIEKNRSGKEGKGGKRTKGAKKK